MYLRKSYKFSEHLTKIRSRYNVLEVFLRHQNNEKTVVQRVFFFNTLTTSIF